MDHKTKVAEVKRQKLNDETQANLPNKQPAEPNW
jgi:hypothetical protein